MSENTENSAVDPAAESAAAASAEAAAETTATTTDVAVDTTEKKITRRDLFMSYLIWTFFSHSNYNYERLQGTAFAHAMTPVIRRLYGGNKEETAAALRRHLVFFNTEPNFGGMIHGVTIAMEEQKASGHKMTDNAITSVKTGLMGPLAGIGDTISQGILVPLFLALGIGIAGLDAAGGSTDFATMTGNPLGPIVYFVLIVVSSLAIGFTAYTQGYYRGREMVTDLFRSGLMDRVITGASVLGNFVLGGLAASFVALWVAPTIHAGGQPLRLQQDFLDKIMPGLLPLSLVVLTWWLLKRGWNPITLLVIYLAICVAGAYPFFGPKPNYVTDACGSALFQPYGPCPDPVPEEEAQSAPAPDTAVDVATSATDPASLDLVLADL